jgi:endonuclease/exonuclease/phosphatase family metal-dependent hydrolase
MRISLGTFNVWRIGEPWRYAEERDVVRGAVPGSAAVSMRPPEGVWERRFPLIAGALEQAELDVVGLQEVSDETPTGGPLVDRLCARLRTRQAGDPATGLAVLTRHEVRSWSLVRMAAPETTAEADRGYGSDRVLHAVIAMPDGDLDFVVVHWSPGPHAARTAAADWLRTYVAGLPRRPLVIVGDLNTGGLDTPELSLLVKGPRPLVDAWSATRSAGTGCTMPSHGPAVRLDYVLVGQGLRPVDAGLIGDTPDADGFYPSDHLGVVATVDREACDPGLSASARRQTSVLR